MTISANFPNVQPSLLLDFANAKQLPPSVTFTRATTATYYDGHTTALAEQNLIIQSQAFGGSPWGSFGSGIALTSSTETDPAGTSTAGLLTFTVGASGFFYEQFTLPAGVNTFSIYAKGGTKTKFDVRVYNNASAAYYSSPDFVLTGSWTRYTYTFTNASTSTINVEIHSGTSPEAGTMYFAFMQMEGRSSMTAYTATTTQPITNYIPVLLTAGGGQPRFDHNPTTSESLGLLIEEQRTNALTYSQDLSNAAWSYINSTITSNTIVAPDGTLTGDKFVEGSTSSTKELYRAYSASALTYTLSFYAKSDGTRNVIRASIATGSLALGGGTYFNVGNGTNTGATNYGASTGTVVGMTSVGNGWYKCFVTVTATAATYYVDFMLANDSNSISYTGNGFSGIFIWGAQLEEGGFATSYIPTTSASATRAPDLATMTGANFTSWFNAGEGTVVYELETARPGANTFSFNFDNGTTSSGANVLFSSAGSGSSLYVTSANSLQVNITSGVTPVAGTFFKNALFYETNNFAVSVNGNAAVTDTIGVLPYGLARLVLGTAYDRASTNYIDGHSKKFAYYPQAVTAAQLAALSS